LIDLALSPDQCTGQATANGIVPRILLTAFDFSGFSIDLFPLITLWYL